MIGRMISHYVIQDVLGEGGMGVVYRALDQRLQRSVALKLLRPEIFADPDRQRRFTQEARAASALNHPNIITIFDIDTTAEGAGFIVMEYVDGKTLDQHIARKRMRLSDVFKYAVQIADGLAAAHKADIVHCDLKPGNIMISEKGLVKLLDFGLGKLTEEPAAKTAEAAATQTLGMPVPHTDSGIVMGTVSYMSPEQAQGLPVDARSDIYTFGAVLYEMITGQRVFQGANRMSTMTSLLRDEPVGISHLAESVPLELDRAVRRCLRKDREKRVQHMSDLKLLLEELRDDSESGRLTATSAAPQPTRWCQHLSTMRVPLVMAAAAALSLWGALQYRNNESTYQRQSPDPFRIAEQEARFANLRAAVPTGAVLAYLTDRPAEDANAVSMFFAAQYHLAPRLLQKTAAGALVLGNFTRPADLAAVGREHGLRIERDFGNGVVLFRRKARP
jgi:serine/threonine protein kinase